MQPNLSQAEKFDAGERETIMRPLTITLSDRADLRRSAAGVGDVTHLIWPEGRPSLSCSTCDAQGGLAQIGGDAAAGNDADHGRGAHRRGLTFR